MNRVYSRLLILATLSGVCGISYELLYTRMLASYFGDIYYITAAMLVAFLTSLGLGALVAHRYARFLPHIEIGIGLYAFLAAYVFYAHMAALVEFAASLGGLHTPLMLALTVVALLFVPAFLIGFSVPIFSMYLQAAKSNEKNYFDGFRHTYVVYNVGAAFAVLLIEFFLIQNFGIIAAALTVGAINIGVGVTLFFVAQERTENAVQSILFRIPGAGWCLFAASAASGIFQLFYLKLSYRIFGPFNENLAIVLTTVFFGIALGTFLVSRYRITFSNVLLFGSAAVSLTAALLTPLIMTWAWLQETVGIPYALSTELKIVALSFFGVAVFTFFGMTVPAYLRERKTNAVENAGQALALSAFGNAAGFLLLAFVLHRAFDLPAIILIVTFTLLLVYITVLYLGKKALTNVAIGVITGVLIASVVFVTYWPHLLLRVGYDRLNSRDQISAVQHEVVGSTDFRHFGDFVSVLDIRGGNKQLVFNGYFSLDLKSTESLTAFREFIVGLHSVLYTPSRDDALVIGLGTGVTAGTVAEMYEHVDVVDVNPSMLDVSKIFSSQNFDILIKDNVTFKIEDGIVSLIIGKKQYDTIINTIASPAYFSASKLWTSESLELVKQRLKPNGVYVTWLDSRVGEAGLLTQIKTLDGAFESCVYYMLNVRYYNVVCGDALSLTPDVDWSEGVRDAVQNHAKTADVSTFLRDLDITPTPEYREDLKRRYAEHAYNSMNKPVLEFLGGGYKYINATATLSFFEEFAAIPESQRADREVLRRRCHNLYTVVNDRNLLLDQLPECSPVL